MTALVALEPVLATLCSAPTLRSVPTTPEERKPAFG
jgi:hypothetical protein